MTLTGKIATMAAGVLLSGAAAGADVLTSWRVNPITPAAITANPALNGAISVSLLGEPTLGSAVDRAFLDVFALFPDAIIFNQAFGSNNAQPPAALVLLFPDLAYDTWVLTGPPAMTSAGELARITFLAGSNVAVGGPTPIPLEFGYVDATPDGRLALAPIPIVNIPEPAFGYLALTSLLARRRR